MKHNKSAFHIKQPDLTVFFGQSFCQTGAKQAFLIKPPIGKSGRSEGWHSVCFALITMNEKQCYENLARLVIQ